MRKDTFSSCFVDRKWKGENSLEKTKHVYMKEKQRRWLPVLAEMILFPTIGMAQVSDTITKSLDEVVVQVAYDAAKRSTITGAVTQVDSKQIAVRPVTSVTAALEGNTAGVLINNTYGEPGNTPVIRIRGFGSVNGTSDPLVVLDGVPYSGSIADLNAHDIESITVLKDAASCALYGNRASNGVVLITTKRDTNRGMHFELNVRQGIYSRGVGEYKRLNANQFMEASWQDMRNSYMSQGKTAEEASAYASAHLIDERLMLNIYNKADDQLFDASGKLVSDAQVLSGYAEDLDWYDQAIRSGYRQEYNFSGSVANSKSDGYFSVNYLGEDGYLKNSDFKRLNGRAQMNFRPKKWFYTGFSLSGSRQNATASNGTSSNSYYNQFKFCRYIAPIYPVHLHHADGSYMLDASGNRLYDSGSYTLADGNTKVTRYQFSDRHVLEETERNSNKIVRSRLQGNFYATFNFLNDFSFKVNGDITGVNQERRIYYSAQIGDGKGSNGMVAQTNVRDMYYTFQQQLRWQHAFSKHLVSAFVGHENYEYKYDYAYIQKSNQTFEGKDNLSNFNTNNTSTGYEQKYRTESYLGRVRYGYDDKYNVEASFRRDGSSRFAEDKRWGNFGSIGVNWNVSKEAFMQSVKWVNSLKLRADFGQVGNDASADLYAYQALYKADKNGGEGAYYISQLANTDLKWETGESFDLGVDARLFDRWNISVDYFDKRNKDLIFRVYLPLSAGATSELEASSSVLRNLGTISNRGFEVSTDVDVFRNRNWKVNFALNAAFISNKVLKLPEQNKQGITNGIYRITEGKSLYQYNIPTFVGVDQMTGNALYNVNLEDNYIKDGDNIIGNENGTNITKKVVKIGGNYYVNDITCAINEDQGSALPKCYGSFMPSVRYKAFSLSALFTFSLGGKVFDDVYRNLMTTTTSASNLHEDIMKSWQGVPEGMTEDSPNRIWVGGIPQINNSLSDNNNAISSRWLTSASYLVLKNLNASYELPRKWMRALDLESATLSVMCENLFTCTKRKGMEPQQTFNGLQSNTLVSARVFSFGINVKF